MKIQNMTSRHRWLRFKDGDYLRLAPGEVSAELNQTEASGGPMLQNLLAQKEIIILTEKREKGKNQPRSTPQPGPKANSADQKAAPAETKAAAVPAEAETGKRTKTSSPAVPQPPAKEGQRPRRSAPAGNKKRGA